MTSADSRQSIRTRRRALLLVGSSLDSAAKQLVHELAEGAKAAIHVAPDGQAATAMVEAEKDCFSLIVLGAGAPDAIMVGRRAAALCPSAELVFLATAPQEVSLRNQIGPAARLGTHWRFLSPSSPLALRTLQSCLQRGEERRSMRTTLDRFNAELAPTPGSSESKQVQQMLLSDRLLSSILEANFDAVVLVDVQGLIRNFNPAAQRLFRKTKLAALGQPIEALALGEWKERVSRILEPAAGVTSLQIPSIIAGESRQLELSATPVSDLKGRLVATSLLVRDVTQKLQVEKALRLNEKLAAVGRLASSIAHEINNPLEAVTNLIYVARLSATDAETRQYLDAADHELRRMAAITSQTLRFHKQSIDARSVTAVELMESVMSIYLIRLSNFNVEVSERFRALQSITCFEGEIRQVLNNLVGNALDAMSASGGRLLLRSRDGRNWRTGEPGLVLTVADTGAGMSPEAVTRVYEPFYTTKGIMGTGLGMWISSEIISQHRGAIHVRSRQRLGHAGTVFSLFLPREAASRTLPPTT